LIKQINKKQKYIDEIKEGWFTFLKGYFLGKPETTNDRLLEFLSIKDEIPFDVLNLNIENAITYFDIINP